MLPLLFTFPECLELSSVLACEKGQVEVRRFPDGESYVRLLSEVKGRNIIVCCGLDRPDSRIMPLLFFCETARELGASHITLVAPYLGYMRQDTRFKEGEAVTSNQFARLLSRYIDRLITVDPHLHRHLSLKEIYSIPPTVVHAADTIAAWIAKEVENPLLIGPDEESAQWVQDTAVRAGGIPYLVLRKVRKGDREVEITVPQTEQYRQHTPVLVDDIISTARTMTETAGHLMRAGLRAPVCIGVHAVFAGDAWQVLQSAGVARIITCNTIAHSTNGIDIAPLIAAALKNI